MKVEPKVGRSRGCVRRRCARSACIAAALAATLAPYGGAPRLALGGAPQRGRGPVPTGLLAGYAGVAAPPDLDDAGARARLELYRLYFALIMSVEIVPRAYVGDWVDGHRRTLETNLRAALDSLA